MLAEESILIGLSYSTRRGEGGKYRMLVGKIIISCFYIIVQ